MKLKKQNCIIYSRVSTEKQSNESAIADLKRYAKYANYKVLKIFKEKISGTTKTADRNAFQELVNFCELNQVDNILVWEISRLSRRGLLDTLEIIKYFTDKKINIFAKKENINTLNEDKTINETSKLTLGILGSIADFGRSTIIETSKRGLHYHLKNGGAFSLSPYGYDNKDKKIVIAPDEASIVKKIYELYLEGKSSPTISKILNSENIPTKKGVQWSDVQIRDILHNPMYYGKRKYNFGFVDVPSIISEAQFIQVQERFKNNSNLNNDKAIYSNYLSGLVHCGKCGLPYYQHARTNKRDFAYKCLSCRKVTNGQLKSNCGNKGININILNSMAYHTIINDLLVYYGSNKLDEIIHKSSNEKKTAKAQIKEEITILKSEIEKLKKKLYNLNTRAIEYNIPIAEYEERRFAIEKEIEKNQEKLNDLLLKQSEINDDSKDVKLYKTLKNNLKSKNIEASANHLLVDLDLYKYYCKTLLKSITINSIDVNDNQNLFTTIPSAHHQRLIKVTISTMFNKYFYYTVSGFPMYAYEVTDNYLTKIDKVEVVLQ